MHHKKVAKKKFNEVKSAFTDDLSVSMNRKRFARIVINEAMKYANDIVENINNERQNLEDFIELKNYFNGLINIIAEKEINWSFGINRDDIRTDTILKGENTVLGQIEELINRINGNIFGFKVPPREEDITKGYFRREDQDELEEFLESFYNLIAIVDLSLGNPLDDPLPNINDSAFINLRSGFALNISI